MMKLAGVAQTMRGLVTGLLCMPPAKPPAPRMVYRHMLTTHRRCVWSGRRATRASQGLMQGSRSMWYPSAGYLGSPLKRWHFSNVWRALHDRYACRRWAKARRSQGRQRDLQRKWRGRILVYLLPVPFILDCGEIICEQGRCILLNG